jgi:hypothetical protein
MMHRFSKHYILLLLAFIVFGCAKTPVTFEDTGNTDDPDIVYYEDFNMQLSTYKTDSFVTSGYNSFMLGTHHDPQFAKITASSYAEILIPNENPVEDKDVIFDSLVLTLVPTGAYYGDSALPLKLSVHELSEKLENEDTADTRMYYPRKFAYSSTPLATAIVQIKPSRREEITVRLPDAIGRDWLDKMKRTRNEVDGQFNFRKFFNGICIKTDSNANQSLFYFSGAGNTLLRLYYKERGITLKEKELNFGYVTSTQYNQLYFNYNNTVFASFPQFRSREKISTEMGGRAYISNNIPSHARLEFPFLLSLKEQHPYVRIVSAILEIKAAPGTANYPYQLPPQLAIYASLDDYNFSGTIPDRTDLPQNGNLFIDQLYGEDTRYRFDVTNYVNQILREGRFSTKAIFISAATSSPVTESSRLIINDQRGRNGIRLKLYVLGL